MYRSSLIMGISLAVLSFSSFADNSIFIKSYQEEAKGQYQKSAQLLEPEVSAKNEFALMRYAYLHYMQGKYNESIDIYKKVIEINPKSIDAKLAITLPLMAQKRWRQVKQYTLQVLSLSHWNYLAHIRLMIAEEGMQKWNTLASHASQLTKTYPSDTAGFVYLARANAWMGNTLETKAAYQQALIRMPTHIEANLYLKKN